MLDQELQRTIALRNNQARNARFTAGGDAAAAGLLPQAIVLEDNKENIDSIIESAKTATMIKKDFFGRVIEAKPLAELDGNSREKKAKREERKVWVTFHEGLNNAVRKPMSMRDFLRGL